ncbi:Uncharacterized protein RSN1 [Grifola frondosa]|uniref:Uncharacterized protein RSN1 n=1 Tax=Grifola frondosa TaxID=5627 RepID=A0A1C7LU15_GRIFR|nr:Uncharacterized protein RSN1 [Grifola frondosa]
MYRRIQALSQKIFLWPWAVFKADYHEIKNGCGMDAYFYVRFLRMMARVLLPIWVISWVVLLPVTSVNTSVDNHTGLDRYSFGNVSPSGQSRYAAHIILTWLFTFWLWYNIRHEMSHFIRTRQRWLIGPENAGSAQACTVLITGVPRRYLTESALANVFSHLPGGVRKVWLNRDLKEMPELHERRNNACSKLEAAETQLMGTALKLHNKRVKKEAKKAKKAGHRVSSDSVATDGRPLTESSIVDTEQGDVELAEKLAAAEIHAVRVASDREEGGFDRLGREEIVTTNAALKESRRALARDVAATSRIAPAETNHADTPHGDSDTEQTYPPLNSAFVLFNEQIAAHMAAQCLTHHGPYRMAEKTVGVAPQDVIWGNLNMNPYDARVRMAISWAITIGLVIVWAIPAMSIRCARRTPGSRGFVPCRPLLSALFLVSSARVARLLMMLLPIVLRLLARFEGMTQRTAIELSLMTRYFIFQVINSFLIVTLSSGIIAALPGLTKDPSSIPSLLAENLPKASTFFLTLADTFTSYIILQGLSGTASGFLQAIPLVLYYVKLFILGSTPRSIYGIKYTLRSVSWGTLFPTTTLLVVITVAYSIISPIINGLAFATFFLFYQMWKYLFMWQLDQPRSSETGGLFFPKAIQHVFVGMYLQQICLAALFFLAQDENKKPSAVPEGALMIVLIVFTVFFHMIINNSYDPLTHYLPLTLAEMHGKADANRDIAKQELTEEASVKELETEKSSLSRRRSHGVSSDAEDEPVGKPKERAIERTEDETERGDGNVPGPEGRGEDEGEGGVLPVDEDPGPKDFYHPQAWSRSPSYGLRVTRWASARRRRRRSGRGALRCQRRMR